MEKFIIQAKQVGVAVTAEQEAKFEAYLSLLLAWNARMNLTAIREPDEIVLRHFVDALSCMPFMGNLTNKRLIDVGTGAGFPGLPLKIMFPTLQLTLVDSVAKKTRFLVAAVEALQLENVLVLAERVEVLGQQRQHREKYDWAVARGVTKMPALSEYLLPLCKVGGHMLAQKGRSASDETASAKHAIHVLGGGKPQLHAIQLPTREQIHYIVLTPKQKKTPRKYPRGVGMPAKTPL